MANAVTKKLRRLLIALPFIVMAAVPATAAPILGQDQQDQLSTPTGPAASQPAVASIRATVLEFTILPSPTDPTVLETTIVLQQAGDKEVCINHASQDIVVRSYVTDADPFAPDIPSSIRGQQSGDVGELAGFNSEKIFIRPRSPQDRFNAPEESFIVGGFQGVFRPDAIECDQMLSDGESVCVDSVIRAGGCALAQHGSLARDLRIMLALNSIPIIAPAAGGPLGQDTGEVFGVTPPGAVGGGLPSGPPGAAPTFPGPGGGSGGGGGLITVPNVIGLPLASAISVITASGLTVGTITASSGDNTNFLDGLFVTKAYAQPFPGGLTGDNPVIDQVPPGGAQVAPLTAVSLVGQASAAPVPEPSTISIFILGLLLALAMYGFSRVRSRTAVGRA